MNKYRVAQHLWIRAVLFLLGLLFSQHNEATAQEKNSCLVCHSEIKSDYLESAHASFGITCVDCHGGDATTLNQASAHTVQLGYRGRPKRTEIPQLCASCHADPTKMKPYGLRTDQYAEYQSSQHGKLLVLGDTRVAVCTDCHTTHRVLPASEPRSTVHPENIPMTCARCHADKELMAVYKIPTDQFDGFRKSVHGVALLEEGNRKSPNCATCHGTHGATPPGIEDISKVCGMCHIYERQYFNVGLHKKAMDERNITECASCHSNHNIEPADSGKLFDTTCLRCHSQNSKEFISGQKHKALLVGAKQALDEAEQILKQARQMAFDISPYNYRISEARAYLIQALPVQHSLDIVQVENLAGRAHSIANGVHAETYGLQTAIRIRWLALALVWVFILLIILTAYLLRRERRGAREIESM